MILFILNDCLKPPKAQHNLSIRHSGPRNSAESKHPSVNMVSRLGEKQRSGRGRNFPEPPEVEARKRAQDLRNLVSPDQVICSFHTSLAPFFHLEKKKKNPPFPGCWERWRQPKAPRTPGGTALVPMGYVSNWNALPSR